MRIVSFLLSLIFLSGFAQADENPGKNQTLQVQDSQQSSQEAVSTGPVAQKEGKYSFLENKPVASAVNQSARTELPGTGDALGVSIGLVVILLMIFFLAWIMKKMGYSNVAGQGQLQIIASLNLGQKEKIALIQVGQQQLLVGITATQINTLHVLDEVLEQTSAGKLSDSTENSTLGNKFSELLKHRQANVQ